MRRRDIEVTDINEICAILGKAEVLHLGLADDGKPYVVPLNYGYCFEDDKLVFYVHGAKEGKKTDIIKNNPECCVQIDCDGKMFEGKVACQYGYTYSSFMGFGKIAVVEDSETKQKGLSVLMKGMTGKDFEFNDKLASIVNVFRMECDSFSAKHRPLPVAMQK